MTILEAIIAVQSIVRISRKSGSLYTEDAEKTATAIRMACTHWERSARSLVTPALRGVAPWAEYEMNVLQLGKALGLVMRKRNLWKGKGAVLDAAVFVLETKSFGRGRQSFAELLGSQGDGCYGCELGAMLDDDEVVGHVIKALAAGDHGEYVEAVQPLAADRTKPWVQNAAKRYVDLFGTPSQATRTRRGLTTREARQARA
jgi:hypothetical protein